MPVLEVKERAWPAGFVSVAIDPTSEGVMVGRDFCQQRDGFQIIPNPSRRLFFNKEPYEASVSYMTLK